MNDHPNGISMKQKMWLTSLCVAAFLFAVFVLYSYAYYGGYSHAVISSAFAASAAVLFGLSFAMSGFGYFFDFLDRFIAYRKYFGLTGFWFALVYAVLLPLSNPVKYWYGLMDNLFTADVMLGILAMGLFTVMALISNSWAMHVLGMKNWKRILRLGYLAYLLLVIRAYLTEKELWAAWFENPSQGLPPARILLSVFALLVIAFRGAIIVAQWRKKRQHMDAHSGTPPVA